MKTRIISFDIDVCGIAAYSNVAKVIASGNSGILPVAALWEHDLVLMEVASPIIYGTKTKGELYNRIKWAIYNSMVAGQIYSLIQQRQLTMGVRPDLLVAPSSAWTLGYKEEIRHRIAGITGDNHDIRECRCMQYFYGTNPEKWTTFEKYFGSLSKRNKS